MADVTGKDQYQEIVVQGVSSADNSTATNIQVNPLTHATIVESIDIKTPDGDSMVDDANDALNVNIVAGAAAGGTSTADDADFTAGTTPGTIVQGVYESSPTSVTDGDVGAIGITQTREVKVSIEADNVGIGGGTQYTEDAAAPADPVGNAMMVTRDDQLATVTEAEGDWSRLRGTSKGALWVALADASGDPITSFGGGTQYTEGDTDATITGTAMMMEGAGDALVAAPGTAADGLLVNLGTNNDVTVTGSVTANAGTNLNTSALLTESDFDTKWAAGLTVDLGANNDVTMATLPDTAAGDLAAQTTDLAAIEVLLGTIDTDTGNIATSLGNIDNAVDGNYLNVNMNLAGTDAQAGEGVITANTQRVTLATDDDGVAHLSTIAGDTTSLDGKITACNTGAVTVSAALPAGTNAIGKLLPSDTDVTGHTNYVRKYYTNAGAVTDGIIWSPAAGKRWHVVTMYIQTSADATVTLEDDKAGGDDPVWKAELAANSGAVLSFTEKYPMASGEDAADLTITTSAGNIYVTCVGYEV